MLTLRVKEGEGIVLAGSVIRADKNCKLWIDSTLPVIRTTLLPDPEASAKEPWLFLLQVEVPYCHEDLPTYSDDGSPRWVNVGNVTLTPSYDEARVLREKLIKCRIINALTGEEID